MLLNETGIAAISLRGQGWEAALLFRGGQFLVDDLATLRAHVACYTAACGGQDRTVADATMRKLIGWPRRAARLDHHARYRMLHALAVLAGINLDGLDHGTALFNFEERRTRARWAEHRCLSSVWDSVGWRAAP